MPIVLSDQTLAVQPGQLAEAAANCNANDPVLKQGDCPPVDAGSSVNAARELKSMTRPDQTAANSLAAAAATAQLDNDLLSGSQERCPPADAGSSAYATRKQNTTAAAQTLRILLLLEVILLPTRLLLPQPPLDSWRVHPLAHNRGLLCRGGRPDRSQGDHCCCSK